jgi:transcriptional regulator with XRE-family HTH domain
MPADQGIPDDEPVGVTLARMRHARGLTGAALAALVGMSQPKISRIERGKGLVEPDDIGILARALGAGQRDAASLMQRAEQSHDRLTDWRSNSNNLASGQAAVAGWERSATTLREFQPALVPGLLQTSGYAEAKSFGFLITESVLRNEICAPAEMLAQINRIRDTLARQSNVSLGIIPDGIRLELPPMHGFALLDDSMVFLDVFNTGALTRGRKDIASYGRVFEIFERHAGPPGPLLDRYEAYYIDRLRTRRSGA